MKKTKVTEIVHKPLADQVIALMQGQVNNPKKRWDAPFNNLNSRPTNAKTKAHFKGVNAMLTTFDTYFNEYKYCLYATKKQWASLGNVPKLGAKPIPIVFYKPMFKDSRIVEDKKVLSGAILLYSKSFNLHKLKALTHRQFLKLVNNIRLMQLTSLLNQRRLKLNIKNKDVVFITQSEIILT
jgi:antirestriction protein ArdC